MNKTAWRGPALNLGLRFVCSSLFFEQNAEWCGVLAYSWSIDYNVREMQSTNCEKESFCASVPWALNRLLRLLLSKFTDSILVPTEGAPQPPSFCFLWAVNPEETKLLNLWGYLSQPPTKCWDQMSLVLQCSEFERDRAVSRAIQCFRSPYYILIWLAKR